MYRGGNIVDNKFFFSVSKNVQSEIENRSNRSNPASSPIGFGAVSASIVKQTSQTIVSLWDTCLGQLKPLKPREEKVETEMDEHAWIYDGFYDKIGVIDENEAPSVSRKRTHDLIESCDNREKLLGEISRKMKKQMVIAEKEDTKPTIHQVLEEYHSKCYNDFKAGCVGMLPRPWQRDDDFPTTVRDLLNTKEGQLLQHFCRRMIK